MKQRPIKKASLRAPLALALAVAGFLAAPSYAFAACSSPAGNAGDVSYSSTQNIMAYCNGTSWVSMGTSGSTGFGTLTSGDLCTATSGTQIACTTAGIALGTQVTGVLGSAYGGTGVNNGANTITLGGAVTTAGAFSTAGAYALTLTTTAATNVTLPTSGTLITNAVTTLSALSSIGTITTGTWNASTITVPYGGTGDTTLAAHGLLIGEGTAAVNVTAAGTAGQLLIGQGASADPSFQTVSGDVTIGSTGVTTIGANKVTVGDLATIAGLSVLGNFTGNVASVNAITGTANQVLVVNNGGTALGFGAVNLGSSAAVSGLLTGTNGGTGVNNGTSTLTLGGNLVTSGTNSLTLTTTGATNVTLPTTGTLITSAVTTLSSLVSIGTVTTGTWNGSVIGPTYGGTGVNNGANTLTLAGNFATSGANSLTLTTTGATNVTLPTSGTLVNTGVTGLSSLSTVGTITNGTWNASTIAVAYGGTGDSSLTQYGVLIGAGTGAVQSTSAGATGTVLMGVTGANPTFGTSPSLTNLTLSGIESLTFGTDYSTTGTLSDVAINTVSAVRFTGTTATTFYGIAAGSAGQLLELHNASNVTLTLSNQSANDSTAASRIITGTGADMIMASNSSVSLQYDGAAARWRVIGGSGGGIPAGTTGQVQFNSGSSTFNADSHMTWDNTNHLLTVGTGAAVPVATTGTIAGITVNVIPQAVTPSISSSSGGITVNAATTGQMAYYSGASAISGTANLYVSGTNIGIGTSSATNLLSLNGASAQTIWMERSTAAGFGLKLQAGGGLSGGSNENGGTLTLAGGISTGTGTSTIQFQTYPGVATGTSDNSPTTAMTILGSGYIGIATTSPFSSLANQSLNVGGADGTGLSGASLDWAISGAGYVAGFYNGGTTNQGNGIAVKINSSSATALDVSLGTTSASTGTSLFNVKGSGYVGIGTTNPVDALDMHVSNSKYGIRVTDPASGDGVQIQAYYPVINFNNYYDGATTRAIGPDYTGKVQLNPTTGLLSLLVGNNPGVGNPVTFINAMSINSSGLVGIGTSAPAYALDVWANSASSAIPMRIYGRQGTTTDNVQLRFAGAKDGEMWAIGSDIAGGGATKDFEFYNVPASATQMTITSAGYVGIGTASPVANFQVRSGTDQDIYIHGPIGLTSGMTISTVNDANNSLEPMEFAASQFYLTGGNVGIGATSPLDRFDMAGTTSSLPGRIVMGDGAAYYPYIKFYGWTGTNSLYYQSTIQNVMSGVGAGLIFQTGGASGAAIGSDTQTTRMVILNTGNVGVGTTAPLDRFNVYGTTGGTTAGQIVMGDGGSYSPYIKSYKWGGSGSSFYQTTIGNSLSTSGAIEFQTGVGGAAIGSDTQTTRMVILPSTGYVGIGTTNPVEKLQVIGTSEATSFLSCGAACSSFAATSGDSAGFTTNDLSITSWWGIGFAPGCCNSTSDAYTVYIDTRAGNVGAAGSFYDSDGAVHSTSDLRLKKDIVSIDGGDALERLGKLNPVRFRWINPGLHGNRTEAGGFVAQELQQVFPQLVEQKNCDGDDCKLVGGGKEYNVGLGNEFIAYMVSAMQRLKVLFDGDHAEIARLQAQNDNQMQAIDQLRREFEAYKKAHP